MDAKRIHLKDLAAALGLEVEGESALEIRGVAPLETAGPDDLAFVRSERFAPLLASTRAGAVIAPRGLEVAGRAVLRSPDPGRDFDRAVRLLLPTSSPRPGRHPSAYVDPEARVDPDASLGPQCAVLARASVGARSVLHAGVVLEEEVEVGEDCELHSGCVVRARSRLGDRVVLQPGVVIGGDGFGYVGGEAGGLVKVQQLGRVLIGDDVEIGANSTVDRGTLGDTTIGRGVKIDNLVQIGHNCRIGERAVIVSQAGLAGSTLLERGAVVLAQAGIAGHLTVGAGALIGPQSGVHKNVPPGTRVLGSPQREERNFHRLMAALTRLPRLLRRVRALEERLGLRESPSRPEE